MLSISTNSNLAVAFAKHWPARSQPFSFSKIFWIHHSSCPSSGHEEREKKCQRLEFFFFFPSHSWHRASLTQSVAPSAEVGRLLTFSRGRPAANVKSQVEKKELLKRNILHRGPRYWSGGSSSILSENKGQPISTRLHFFKCFVSLFYHLPLVQ